MTAFAIALLAALAVFLVLYVTVLGRRRLAQRTTTVVPVPPEAPGAGADDSAGPGAVRFGPLEAVYVSTTLHGDWLARVGAHGLGDRSAAQVTVHDAGISMERAGARDLWVPVDAIRSANLAPGMAGKYVGADGLVVVTWAVPAADGVPPALVDTGLRPRRPVDRGALVDAVRHLLAEQQPTQQHHPQHHPYQQEAR
ncbi:MAG TPA: hypothetical protein VKY86_19465 [Promicromonospora sp.]|nr:hypothetical protein [Promicromonospora sp.]